MKSIIAAAGLALLLTASAAPAAQPWFTRVLITNDDGIDDPRLAALAQAFAQVAEVVVVAPLSNCSGSTNYVSAFQSHEVRTEPRELGGGVEAWGADGFPGDCVLLAVTGLMADAPPDLIVSGVNSGPNLADAYLASGTIGAARLGAQLGLPSVAFSNLDAADASMMAAVPAWCVDFASDAAVRDLAPGQYLTVNFPDGPASQVEGVCWAPLGGRVFHDAFDLAACDPQGGQLWRQRWWFDDGDDQPADGDVARQRSGWITVTPMRLGDLDEARLAHGLPLPGWKGAGR